ncbi:MAG: hypothetical protein SFV19_08350 [Rhodospirillaceae bacterium]|nr:hypothetical protein [Rhodospirillaceae bacterium]
MLKRISLVLASFAAVAGCSDGPSSGPGRREAGLFMQGLGESGQIIRPGPNANKAYSDGIDLKRRGDCKAALAKLEPVAKLGPGYENAQFALGDCLIGLASTGDSAMFADGLTWLIRAADGGWTEAQGKLAQIYALGPMEQHNLDEAAYWLALYRGNASLARIGFTPMESGVESAIAAAVGADRLRAANARAAQWRRNSWIPPKTEAPPGPEAVPGRPATIQRRGPGDLTREAT